MSTDACSGVHKFQSHCVKMKRKQTPKVNVIWLLIYNSMKCKLTQNEYLLGMKGGGMKVGGDEDGGMEVGG